MNRFEPKLTGRPQTELRIVHYVGLATHHQRPAAYHSEKCFLQNEPITLSTLVDKFQPVVLPTWKPPRKSSTLVENHPLDHPSLQSLLTHIVFKSSNSRHFMAEILKTLAQDIGEFADFNPSSKISSSHGVILRFCYLSIYCQQLASPLRLHPALDKSVTMRQTRVSSTKTISQTGPENKPYINRGEFNPYVDRFRSKLCLKSQGAGGKCRKWSERQDSNLRRLAPKASALPG